MAIIDTSSTAAGPGSGSATDLAFANSVKLVDGTVSQQSAESGDWGFALIPQSASTLIKTGPGQLGRLIVGTATGNITVYDGLDNTGTKIIDTSAIVAGTQQWNISFKTGLYITLSGAGIATVTYK